MKYSHRFFLYAPVAAIIVLATLVSVYWYETAHAFGRKLDALNGHEIAPGVTFHFTSRKLGGFPFRVDAVLENMRFDVTSPKGPASWKAEHFALHMLDYGRAQFIFEAAGKQAITWHDGKGAVQHLHFTPALLRASAIASHGALARFDVELYGAVTKSGSVAHTELHIRRNPKADQFDMVFMADDVHLAPQMRTALGDVIAKLRLKAKLVPAESWHNFLAGKTGWRKAAETWRAADGALDIAKLEVAWGKADATGKGAMTLDHAHRPTGLIKLHIDGYQGLADEAARRGLATGAQKTLLAGLMADAAANGKDPAKPLAVTLAFKDGIAYVNQMPAGFLDTLY
jgi:hypothetical protein